MNTNDQTNSSSIFSFNEDQWEQMPANISKSLFSDVAHAGGNDLSILRGANKPRQFKDKEYLAMKLTNPEGSNKHLVYLGGSSNDPSTWTIEKDITSMQSGAFASFGRHGNECLITSCLKIAVYLRFKLDMSVVCTFNIKNTKSVVENIQRLAHGKGNKSPVLFVLCEDATPTTQIHESVIELEPRNSNLISLACNHPELLKKKIDFAFTEFKDSQKYLDLVTKIEKISQHSQERYIPGGDKLFKDIYDLFKIHIEIRESDLVITVLYILFTYVFRKSPVIPFLYIASPEAGAGKTIMLSILKLLCSNPGYISDTTAPIIADYSSTYETVILDEFDQCQDKPGITTVLNIGYRPGDAANHTRLSPGRKPIVKNVASAKIIAGIGYPNAPTIRDRSVFVNLQVCNNTAKFPDVDLSGLGLSILKDECEKWAVSAKEKFAIQSMNEDNLVNLKRRLMDNYNCVLKVANCLSGEIFKMAVDACKQNAIDEKPEDSMTLELIIDILKIINVLEKNVISRDQLAELLIAMHGRPWKSRSTRGDSFSLYVGSVLKSYRIRTTTVRVGKVTAKGFKKSQFNELLSRFEAELNSSVSVDLD